MRYLLIYVCIWLTCLESMGQQQKFYIHTAKGENSRTEALSGVYLSVEGNYNGDRSDKNGTIIIHFPDKKNGDPFRIKNVEKKGFILTDKYWLRHDASLSSKVRVDIAMKSESQIRRERAEWSHKITSVANENWYKKEKALNDSLEKQKITIELYEKEVDALNRARESLGQMISYMSEYCASMDFSKITDNQRKVLELLKKGDIEGADLIIGVDSVSDEEIIANIKKTRNRIARARQKSDSLSNAVGEAEETLRKQIEAAVTNFILKAQIAYQKSEFGLVQQYYRNAADVDSTNVDRQIEAACAYLIYDEDIDLYKKYYSYANANKITREDEFKCLELDFLFNIFHGNYISAGLDAVSMIKLYFNPEDYIDYIVIVEADEEKDNDDGDKNETSEDGITKSYSEKIEGEETNISEIFSNEISKLLEVNYGDVKLLCKNDSINCSTAFSYLSSTCGSIGKLKESISFLSMSLIFDSENNSYDLALSRYFGTLNTLINNGYYKEALELCEYITSSLSKSLSQNQDSPIISIINMYAALCRCKMDILKGNEIEVFKKGLEKYGEIVSPQSLPFLVLKSNLIQFYMAEKSYSKAIAVADSILDQIKLTAGMVPLINNYGISNNKGTCYYYMQEYEKAINIFMDLQRILDSEEAIAKFGGNKNIILQALNYFNIAQNYRELGNIDKAIEYHEKALLLRKKYYKDSAPHPIYESYNSLIPIYASINKYEKALELLDEFIFLTSNDERYSQLAIKLKYETLVKQIATMGLTKKIKKSVDSLLKDRELALLDTRSNAIFILLDYDRYKGFPKDLRNAFVFTPSKLICKLHNIAGFKKLQKIIIQSSSKDIKEHQKVYKQWLKENRN